MFRYSDAVLKNSLLLLLRHLSCLQYKQRMLSLGASDVCVCLPNLAFIFLSCIAVGPTFCARRMQIDTQSYFPLVQDVSCS